MGNRLAICNRCGWSGDAPPHICLDNFNAQSVCPLCYESGGHDDTIEWHPEGKSVVVPKGVAAEWPASEDMPEGWEVIGKSVMNKDTNIIMKGRGVKAP